MVDQRRRLRVLPEQRRMRAQDVERAQSDDAVVADGGPASVNRLRRSHEQGNGGDQASRPDHRARAMPANGPPAHHLVNSCISNGTTQGKSSRLRPTSPSLADRQLGACGLSARRAGRPASSPTGRPRSLRCRAPMAVDGLLVADQLVGDPVDLDWVSWRSSTFEVGARAVASTVVLQGGSRLGVTFGVSNGAERTRMLPPRLRPCLRCFALGAG